MKTLEDIAKSAFKQQSKLHKEKCKKDVLKLIELLKTILDIKATEKDINWNNNENPHYDKIDKLSIQLDDSYTAKLMANLTVKGAKYTSAFNTIIELNDFIQKTLVNHS